MVRWLAREHTCTAHGYTHSSVARAKEGVRGWVEVGQVGEWGNICNIVNNKDFKLKKNVNIDPLKKPHSES